MKLTLKILTAFVVMIVLILGCDTLLLLRQRSNLVESGMRLDMARFGRVLAEVVREEEDRHGAARTSELLGRLNTEDPSLHIRAVTLGAHDPQMAPGVELSSADAQALVQSGSVSYPGQDTQGHNRMVTYVLLRATLGGTEALEISQSLSAIDRYTHSVLMRALVLAGVMLATGTTTSLVVGVWMVGKPLGQLIAKTHRVGAGDLASPVQIRGRDELGHLGRAFNEMCDQLSASRERVRQATEARIAAVEQLRHADRLRTVGRLAAGVAHEIGTPLNVISGRAAMVAEGGLSDAEARDNAQIIRRQAERITSIIRHLLDFSRRSAPARTRVDLRRLVQDTGELLVPLARQASVTLDLLAEGPALDATVDHGQIQQVLTNLLMNGIQATPAGGKVTVAVTSVQAAAPDLSPGAGAECKACWRIDVTDTGVGIPPQNMAVLFEPFFTTKEVGKGTGLGLAVAHGIVREHDGWIEVASQVDKGSCFSVFLPREAQA